VIKFEPHPPEYKDYRGGRHGHSPVNPEAGFEDRAASGSFPVKQGHCEECLGEKISIEERSKTSGEWTEGERAEGIDGGSWCGIRLVEKKSERAGGLTATNVPGRKNMVSRAMAFIAEESRLLSRAMSLL
jgi:hypothetical protein